jgi:hypothetical protein
MSAPELRIPAGSKKALSASKVFVVFSEKSKEIEQERGEQGLYRQLKNDVSCDCRAVGF